MEFLTIYGVTKLNCLIKSVNEEWNSVCETGTCPQAAEIRLTALQHCTSPESSAEEADEEAKEVQFMPKSSLGSIATLLSPLSRHSL